MKSFAERNPFIVGAVGVALTVGVGVAALNYKSLPLVNQQAEYSAHLADASGLTSGEAVDVSGMEVGQVESLSLDGPRVLVKFNLNRHIFIGDRSEVAIKTKSVLGAKFLEVTPRGDRRQSGTIPLERTTSAYQLPDALGDITAAISGLNTDQLSQSLSVLSDTFKDTPPELKIAVQGVARFSDTIDQRDAQLRNLLANANKTTGVLAQRSDQVVSLIGDTDALLVELQSQSAALEQISGNISAVARQIKGFIGDNKKTLKPALDKLNGVLTIVDNRKHEVQTSIKRLNAYAMSLGESVSSGPFFKAYLVNLIPGQFVQPFVDAAFSDLGLDPSTLSPSQLTDPQTGQPATPALPVPYPRTGQGGPPNLTLPDAITGNPGDHPCPGSGPGCYPYRAPLPAPPPGGPPPGPPAPPLVPGAGAEPAPSSSPVYLPAPGEIAPAPVPPQAAPQPPEGGQ
ncbi:MAG: phospholipid/cholesterol/gamma-HCH transport system substrate-binding protein [Mycobacterium sp.]|jgi:phospholipid/cholesterol/gamma-HCH transport system substrate-binding protein|nr:phospholipid/cholesterol/gamma-HCH transport system substrate-binding protein [Mycobacterium sp.]